MGRLGAQFSICLHVLQMQLLPLGFPPVNSLTMLVYPTASKPASKRRRERPSSLIKFEEIERMDCVPAPIVTRLQ